MNNQCFPHNAHLLFPKAWMFLFVGSHDSLSALTPPSTPPSLWGLPLCRGGQSEGQTVARSRAGQISSSTDWCVCVLRPLSKAPLNSLQLLNSCTFNNGPSWVRTCLCNWNGEEDLGTSQSGIPCESKHQCLWTLYNLLGFHCCWPHLLCYSKVVISGVCIGTLM